MRDGLNKGDELPAHCKASMNKSKIATGMQRQITVSCILKCNYKIVASIKHHNNMVETALIFILHGTHTGSSYSHAFCVHRW